MRIKERSLLLLLLLLLGASVKQTQQYLCVVIISVSKWPDHQSLMALTTHKPDGLNWRFHMKSSSFEELIPQLYRNTPQAFHALINIVGGKLLDICIQSFV